MRKFVEPDVADNPLYHDTWKLLKKYRDVVWSLELSVQHVRTKFEIEYGTSIEDFLDSVYLAGADYWFDGGPEYFHYGAHNTSHVFEAQVGYDFGPLAVNWYTNFAGADGVKANGDRAYSSYFSIAAPFKLGGLDWSAEIGATPWETSFYNNGASGFEVSNICLGASKEIKITDSYSLPVFAHAICNPATEGAYFVFGISF